MDRTTYLGSADAKDIASLEPFGCRRAMVYRKAGVPVDNAERHREKFDGNQGPVARGVALEPLIRDRVDALIAPCYEWKVGNIAAMMPPRPASIPDWLRATPDGIVCAAERKQELAAACGVTLNADLSRLLDSPGILEAKTVQRSDFWRIVKQGPREDHIIQTQHQLAATGAGWCLVVYLHADDWRWCYYLIRRDEEWERETYIPAAIQAWSEVTRAQSGINLGDSPDQWEAFLPPRLKEGSKQCRTCDHRQTCWGSEFLRVMGIPVEGDLPSLEGDPEWVAAAAEYVAAKELYDECALLKAEAEERLKVRLGDLPGAEGGGLRVHYKPSVQRRIDTAALKAKHPKLAARFTKEIPVRALRAYQV